MSTEAKNLANLLVFDTIRWFIKEDIKPTSLTNLETEVYRLLIEFEKQIIKKHTDEKNNY